MLREAKAEIVSARPGLHHGRGQRGDGVEVHGRCHGQSRDDLTVARIGVNHESGGKFSAHAWLQRGDAVVMGYIGREHGRYTPFPGMRGLEPF